MNVRGEYVILSISILFSFLAFILTGYGMGIYGFTELNPYNNFWLSNGLGYVGFIINSLMIIAVFKFVILNERFKFPDKYRFICVGIFMGVTVADLSFDALNLLSVNI